MMHIEFAGPPGSGKSTLHSKVLNGHENMIGNPLSHMYECNRTTFNIGKIIELFPDWYGSKIRRYIWNRKFRAKLFNIFKREYPDSTNAFYRAARYSPRDTKRIHTLIKRAASEYMFLSRNSKTRNIVIDEGLCQYSVVAVEAFENSNKKIPQEYLESIPSPDIVLITDCPGEVSLNRQDNRANGRASAVRDLSDNKAAAHLEKQRQRLNIISKKLEGMGCEVVQIDTYNQSVDESFEQVMSSLGSNID